MAELYDDDESFDATDHGEDTADPADAGTLQAELLDRLHAAGFREAR